jgi:dCTP deaminase
MPEAHKLIGRHTMSESETGVLPRQYLEKLFDAGFITGVSKEYLNPSSIDLPLSDEAFRVDGIFFPERGERVRDLINLVGGKKHDMQYQFEVGISYLVRVEGNWKLPVSMYGYANPKSSAGRINLFSRVLADGVSMYDAIITEEGKEWSGELWVLIRAESFPVMLTKKPGKTLAVSQVRIFSGKSFLNTFEINCALEKHGLLFDSSGKKIPREDIRTQGEAMLLTLRVGENMGWECRGTGKLLDFTEVKDHDPDDFFEPVSARDGTLLLRKGGFYILSTEERVMIPPNLSAELRSIDVRLGEFRSHAAGYVDSGWGYGEDGSKCGNTITLEVIPHENILVRYGQPIARIRFERMLEAPLVPYDQAKSNYVDQQSARLSKHFRDT